MRGLVIVVLAGCGFEHGMGRPEGQTDAAGNAVIDAMAQGHTCYDKWLAGTIRFSTPVLIPGINDTLSYDRDPFLPADELTIFFSTGRTGTGKVFMASRTSVTSPFGAPEEATWFSSTLNETKLSLSSDGLIAVVASDRAGGAGGVDVWESIRSTTTENWPAMNRTNVMMVETNGDELDPTLSADGQRLYLAPTSPSPQHLAVATRSASGELGPAVPIALLNSTSGDADPSPTPDERIMTFSSKRSGSADLYYATRATANAAFGVPLPIPDVNTSAPEGDPHVSADGCRIYFARTLEDYQYDLYMAAAQ